VFGNRCSHRHLTLTNCNFFIPQSLHEKLQYFHILNTNPNNKRRRATLTTRITTLNPNHSICCKIRNAKATNKERTAPYKRDSINGVSGNKNTLIMGTSKMGNRIATITKRHFLSHHFAIAFPIITYVQLLLKI